jgi:hypothetical protein
LEERNDEELSKSSTRNRCSSFDVGVYTSQRHDDRHGYDAHDRYDDDHYDDCTSCNRHNGYDWRGWNDRRHCCSRHYEQFDDEWIRLLDDSVDDRNFERNDGFDIGHDERFRNRHLDRFFDE